MKHTDLCCVNKAGKRGGKHGYRIKEKETEGNRQKLK